MSCVKQSFFLNVPNSFKCALIISLFIIIEASTLSADQWRRSKLITSTSPWGVG